MLSWHSITRALQTAPHRLQLAMKVLMVLIEDKKVLELREEVVGKRIE